MRVRPSKDPFDINEDESKVHIPVACLPFLHFPIKANQNFNEITREFIYKTKNTDTIYLSMYDTILPLT
ncbi:hypothetical protein L2E82_26827 [Cichorium intybus]|uniref:Uncharacterized protein n=1 Tax=Cichorium intybus TaxID=13427 RepID=A0ACB9CRE6_CICIN|nr:hypothetical protein L2E82_26827 [Cichorium intybus]